MDKTLIITGGSRGIGLATASLFSLHGYQVINLSRTPIPLDNALHLPVDLSEPDWNRACMGKIHAHIQNQRHLVLVHNAGLLYKDSVVDVTRDALQRVLQINLIAPVQLNQLLLPLMKKGSAILYVGSTLAGKAVANACSYAVSKHALIGLMRATCQDLAGTGIHTACICPGFTDTDMLREHVGDDTDVLDSLTAYVAMERLISPQEIADTLYFCAGNSVLNGAVIHANLGQIER